MFTSLKYVFGENFRNLYRIYCIAKYELLADMRDSKFGIFWNFASPAIQVLTYWLIFGLAWSRKPIGDIEYLPWLVIGYSAWWFIQPCIQSGCSAIFSKTGVITKMKFPVSILPATICAKEFFNHLCDDPHLRVHPKPLLAGADLLRFLRVCFCGRGIPDPVGAYYALAGCTQAHHFPDPDVNVFFPGHLGMSVPGHSSFS